MAYTRSMSQANKSLNASSFSNKRKVILALIIPIVLPKVVDRECRVFVSSEMELSFSMKTDQDEV